MAPGTFLGTRPRGRPDRAKRKPGLYIHDRLQSKLCSLHSAGLGGLRLPDCSIHSRRQFSARHRKCGRPSLWHRRPAHSTYARISFAKNAKEEGVSTPRLHTFVNNRVTTIRRKASKAFAAVSKSIKQTMDTIHTKHRQVFAAPRLQPSKTFIEIPDYHTACIVASLTGTPLHKLKAGPHLLLRDQSSNQLRAAGALQDCPIRFR